MTEENQSSNTYLFENVCDDVWEQILSYLPFNDKIKLEGVSKQWQRLIYNQQTIIKVYSRPQYEDNDTLNMLLEPLKGRNYISALAMSFGVQSHRKIKKQDFENVLKRCPSIKTVELMCFTDDYDLKLIGKHLERLEIFKCDMFGEITDNGLLEFGRNCGQKLKTLNLFKSHDMSDSIEPFLNYCPNIREINNIHPETYVNEDKLPKLEIICSKETIHSDRDIEYFRKVIEKYKNRLKVLDVVIGERIEIIPYIGSLVNLKKLVLNLYVFEDIQDNEESIDKYLLQLSKKCKQLQYFGFYMDFNEMQLPLNMFQAFSNFYSIKTLNIRICLTENLIDCKSEYFKLCTNLKQLRLEYKKISDTFFQDIDQHISNLRSIDIDTMELLTDQSLLSLAKLKKLKKVWLRQFRFANKYITDLGVCDIIDSCTHIEDIYFASRPKITNATIDRLILIAKQRARKMIKFKCYLSNSRDELQYDEQIDVNRLNELPDNLEIIILMQ